MVARVHGLAATSPRGGRAARFALCALALGCGPRRPPAPGADAADLAAPRPIDAVLAVRPEEPDAIPIRKEDILEGAAAEQALAAGADGPRGGDAAAARGLTLRPDGVGPYTLRAPRDPIVEGLPPGTRVVRTPGPTGEPTPEAATLRDAAGPYLTLRFLGGRLVAIEVLAARPGLETEAGLRVGQTFESAIDLYGPPRAYRTARTGTALGWVLADLPGVVLQGPAPSGAIRGMLVLGPETTSPPD